MLTYWIDLRDYKSQIGPFLSCNLIVALSLVCPFFLLFVIFYLEFFPKVHFHHDFKGIVPFFKSFVEDDDLIGCFISFLVFNLFTCLFWHSAAPQGAPFLQFGAYVWVIIMSLVLLWCFIFAIILFYSFFFFLLAYLHHSTSCFSYCWLQVWWIPGGNFCVVFLLFVPFHISPDFT